MLSRRNSGIKLMLLGINLTLVGGILAVDPHSSFGGLEFVLVLGGLIVSFLGLSSKD